jgi:hypothetical protein
MKVVVLLGPDQRLRIARISVRKRVEETQSSQDKNATHYDRNPFSAGLAFLRDLGTMTLFVLLAAATRALGVTPDLLDVHDERQCTR